MKMDLATAQLEILQVRVVVESRPFLSYSGLLCFRKDFQSHQADSGNTNCEPPRNPQSQRLLQHQISSKTMLRGLRSRGGHKDQYCDLTTTCQWKKNMKKHLDMVTRSTGTLKQPLQKAFAATHSCGVGWPKLPLLLNACASSAMSSWMCPQDWEKTEDKHAWNGNVMHIDMLIPFLKFLNVSVSYVLFEIQIGSASILFNYTH